MCDHETLRWPRSPDLLDYLGRDPECAHHAALIEQIVPTPKPVAAGDASPGKKRGAKDGAQMNLFGTQPASRMPLFDRPDED